MLNVRRSLAQCAPIKAMKNLLLAYGRSITYALSPALLAKLRYRFAWGEWPDLRNPQSYDEKLLWLMLYWRHPLKTQCGDKYTMRSYVEEQGLGHILPKLLGVYELIKDIDFATLPDQFVLKCTHGCKCNIFCKNRLELDVEEAKKNLKAWMRIDFSRILGEIHYGKMKPRIICEEFLQEPGAELPTDYKIYCFHGKAHCTMVCAQRSPNGKARLEFFDREWKVKLPYSLLAMPGDQIIAKPSAYEEIIEAAERLSKPFPFVRVDFYNINDRAVLGEMTFTPGACISESYMTQVSQKQLGDLIKLPETYLG